MLLRSSIVLLALYLSRVSAVPARRQETSTSPKSVEKSMENGIQGFLGTQNVELGGEGVHVLLPKGGMTPIQFLASSNWMNDTEANNIIFNTLDRNQDPSSNSTVHMSDQYTNFIQDVTKAIGATNGTDITEDSEIAGATEAFRTSCGALSELLTKALTRYAQAIGEEGGEGSEMSQVSKTDENFLLWAQADDVDYKNGVKNCDINKQAYQKIISEKLGNNYALFMGAFANIQPIIDPGPKPVPGITMGIRARSGPQTSTDTGAGSAVPYYRLPMLDSLVQQWKEGQALSPWEFSSESSTTHTDSETNESSANFGFDWRIISGEVGTDSSSTETNSLSQNQKFSVKWQSMALVEIDRGSWYNDRVAGALRAPIDDVAKKAQKVFTKYFGTSKEDAKAASIYNDKVIIGFQPSVSIEFSSEEEATKAKHTAATAGLNLGLFTIGGSGAKDTESTDTKVEGKTLTYTDGSMNAYILGYVQRSFWDSESAVQAGDISDSEL